MIIFYKLGGYIELLKTSVKYLNPYLCKKNYYRMDYGQ